VPTRTRLPSFARAALVALAGSVFLAACDSGPLHNLASGTKSKDKKPIPSTVHASASGPAGAAAAPKISMQGPAPTDKVTAEAPTVPDDPSKPLREQVEEYRAGQQRDPFVSLLGGDDRPSGIVDLAVAHLVGIVTSGDNPFCVVEDAEGTSFVLHVGDAVKNGRVVAIKPEALVCSQTVLGYTTTVQLKLEERKDVKHG